jgi:LysM repeat protein
MDGKIKLVAVASIVAIMASGCSSYRGASQGGVDTGNGGYSSGGGLFGQRSGSGQVARTGQVRGGGFGQQRANTAASCAPCGAAAPKPQSTYTYKPAKPAPKQPVQTGQYNQQYYIDKWNREQAQQKPAPKPAQDYTGYGTAPSNTTYYDYSSAGKANAGAANANVATSNKSIYTGSYQQKTYKPYAPTTYAGGTAATTGTAAYANTAGTSSATGGGSTYIVKKGDTVFEIMRQTGVYWKDIISINNLQPPYNINPGQTIRLK